MRLTVRVYPGARRTQVGGRYGTDDPPVLIVRVAAPATGGRANTAIRTALATAFDVPASAVRIRTGRTHRTKIVEIDDADTQRLSQRLSQLLTPITAPAPEPGGDTLP